MYHFCFYNNNVKKISGLAIIWRLCTGGNEEYVRNYSRNPEELRATAKQYGVESQEVLNQVDRLNRMISDLKGMWEGASSEAFADQYEQLKPSFIKMSDLLTDVSNQLDQTANTLESTDQDIASQIRG